MSLATYLDSALHTLLEGRGSKRAVDRLIARADSARDQGDWPQAAKDYQAAISAGCRRPGMKVQLGHALKEMGDFDGAEGQYREFLLGHPDDADIHLQLGHLFNKRGDPTAALSFYEQAHRLAPDDGDIAHHAGMAQRNAGRVDVFRKKEAAMRLVAARKWQEARCLLRSLVMIEGERELIGILANVTKETGQLDEAEAHYECYLSYAKSSGKPELITDCHLQLGHLYKIKGEYTLALHHFLSARKIERASGQTDPEDSELEREIVACLREIYPCFLFGDDNRQ